MYSILFWELSVLVLMHHEQVAGPIADRQEVCLHVSQLFALRLHHLVFQLSRSQTPVLLDRIQSFDCVTLTHSGRGLEESRLMHGPENRYSTPNLPVKWDIWCFFLLFFFRRNVVLLFCFFQSSWAHFSSLLMLYQWTRIR